MITAPRGSAPLLLAAWLALIAVLTLSPQPDTPVLTLGRFLCVGCGGRDTADIIVNWAAFLPGGALMALVAGGRRALLAAAALTAAVETVQIGIPGRDPALQDLLANTAGALSGVLVVRRGLSGAARRALAVVAGVAWLAPLGLLVPRTTTSVLYGQWTPAFSAMEQYGGRILSAFVGERPVRNGPIAERGPVDSAVLQRRPVEILLVAGPPPPGRAPVFQVVDERRTSILSLVALGEDLIVRGHNPSQQLRLDQPDIRWRGALESVDPGDPQAVGLDRSRDSVCMWVGETRTCGLAPSLGSGWGHLVHLDDPAVWLEMLMTVAWSVCLGALLGVMATTVRGAALASAGVATVGFVAALVSPDVRPVLAHALLYAAGGVLGGLSGRLIWRVSAASGGD